MGAQKRLIFRESAIKQYVQRRDKDILPRFIAPPVFLFLWIIIALLIMVGVVVSNIYTPVYVSGLGIITAESSSGQAVATVVLSAGQLRQLHFGQSVSLHTGSNGADIRGTITAVNPAILSPQEARRQYHLDSVLGLVVTQPSAIVTVSISSAISMKEYVGSLLTATVQVGSRKLITSFTF